MEKELAGSNSSLSSSYRQWAAVRANLLPIWEKELATGAGLCCTNQDGTTIAVDIIVFVVFIPKKCSNPRVRRFLKKVVKDQKYFSPLPRCHQRSFAFHLQLHNDIEGHSRGRKEEME